MGMRWGRRRYVSTVGPTMCLGGKKLTGRKETYGQPENQHRDLAMGSRCLWVLAGFLGFCNVDYSGPQIICSCAAVAANNNFVGRVCGFI